MNYKEVLSEVKAIISGYDSCGGEDFKDKNFITPEVIAYKQVGSHKVEFSIGTGIFTDYLIGVTVDGVGDKSSELSDCCEVSELKDKIKEIKRV